MKRILVILVLLLVAGGGWYLLKNRKSAEAEPFPEKPVAKVETLVLKETGIAQTLNVFGLVASSPAGERVITASFECVVRTVEVGVGTRVSAGEVLLEIDPSPESQFALQSARSALALAAKGLAATQERYDLKLATQQDLLTAQQAADDAQLKVASFERRGLGGDGKITAPATGVVSKIDVSRGGLVAAGTPLAVLSTGGGLEVRCSIETTELDSIRPGLPVVVHSSNRPDAASVTTTLRSVGAALDATTGSAEARASLPANAPLLLGEHVRASIELRKKDHVLVVPRSAVLPEAGRQVLFTVKDGKAVKHDVSIGIATDEAIEVAAAGLVAGDRVVTLGNYELEDGMAVRTVKADADAVSKAATEVGR
ncbi:MAG: efflux RND transporter periplasmic adaptor subunit [Opitutus sp.]